MLKTLYLSTLADRTWWTGMLQLAVGVYIALMGVFATFLLAAETFQLFRIDEPVHEAALIESSKRTFIVSSALPLISSESSKRIKGTISTKSLPLSSKS